jgi:hypothetical protein
MPRRWSNAPIDTSTQTGTRRGCIENKEIAALLVQLCVAWSHFEDQMISVFHDLLGNPQGDIETARLILTSLVNQKIRIDLMQALLEYSRLNRDKGEVYDEILDEFRKLNNLRNRYVHGLWWTHENGDTFLQSDNSVPLTHVKYQKVTVKDLQSFLTRLNALWQLVLVK